MHNSISVELHQLDNGLTDGLHLELVSLVPEKESQVYFLLLQYLLVLKKKSTKIVFFYENYIYFLHKFFICDQL